jgi:hypothetical protein
VDAREAISVRDVDVVVQPGEANLLRLHHALAGLAIRPAEVPPARRLCQLSVARVTTSYGRVDCLLQRGREDWDRLARNAKMINVADVGVLVASAADAWALRHRFKG